MAGDASFGERMAALRRERGVTNIGRPRIRDKHGRYVSQTEGLFAQQMPVEAARYIEQLEPKGPEVCPFHGQPLSCPVDECSTVSQRTQYDFKAAAYLFDRIMGKPTTRSENTITVKLVQELTASVVLAFTEVNGIEDAHARREAFAAKLVALGADYGGAVA